MSPKSALVTGCSVGGIGDAIAQALHRRGLRVFATARTLSKIQHLKDMGMDVVQLDVTNPASVQQAVKTVNEATGGTLDVLINNSGVGKSKDLFQPYSIEKVDEEEIFPT
jgi:1-acylglycerone phosphate reductase